MNKFAQSVYRFNHFGNSWLGPSFRAHKELVPPSRQATPTEPKLKAQRR